MGEQASMIDSGGAANPEPGWIPDGHPVASNRGVGWLTEGWALYRKEPIVFTAQTVVVGLIMVVAVFIPLTGVAIFNVLTPIFAAGFLVEFRLLSEGKTISFEQLFEGFKNRTVQLALLGFILAVASFIIMLPAKMSGGDASSAIASLSSGKLGDIDALRAALIGILVSLALYVPLAMASWFAPPLILFHEVSAVDALKHSFLGCLKNIVPFLLYGIVSFLLMILAVIPLFLGFLVLVPVLLASIYLGYRDIFLAGPGTQRP